jgi:DNA repair exonuclease SbcCD nuclease subunit
MSIPFRFIHAADLHLDSPFKGLQDAPDEVWTALRDSTFRALRHLTETALAAKADFVVLSGDLYDASDRSLRAQLALQREWRVLSDAGVGVFVIHGNHDPLSGAKANLDLPETVRIFGSGEPEGWPAYRKDGELAAYVYGLSYGTRAVSDNVALRYRPHAEAPFHVALLHGNVDGDPSHDPYAPCKLSELAGAGFDYWALGHIHQRKVLHTYPHVVYSGNTQGRHANETGEKGCFIVDVTASKEVNMTFRPLDDIRWLDAEVSIAGLETEQALKDKLEEACDGASAGGEGRPVMLKLIITGRGPMHGKLADPVFCRELLQDLRESRGIRGDQERTDWIWIHKAEVLSGTAIAFEELREEESFAGELLRLSDRLAGDPAALRLLMEEAEAPLREQTRLRKLQREAGGYEDGGHFAQAREYVLDLLTGEEGR